LSYKYNRLRNYYGLYGVYSILPCLIELCSIDFCKCLQMSAVTALLGQFEQQYSVNTAEITAKIGQLTQLPKSEQAAAVNEIRRLLVDVEELLGQMELSVHELDAAGPDRSKYDLRVKSYRSDKRQLENELTKAIQRLKDGSSRDELLGFDEGISIDQQDQLIANTQRLDRTSRKIEDAYRITVETEQIGAEVPQNLGQQRETISRARERMREADAELLMSNKLVSRMIQRVIQNRLVLLIVAVVMMFSLLILIYRAL
jgi:vesicle transport through interaction with t-SNAREs protein 1